MDENSEFKRAELKRSKRREHLLALALISPYIVIFLLFTVVPVVMGIAFSFMRYNPYSPEENTFYGFRNFINLFNFNLPISKSFWQSFTTMLTFDAVIVPSLIIIPLVLAYFINMHPPGYKIFRAIIYLPSVVSISITGIIFGNMFQGDSSGLINAWLGTEIHWLSGSPWQGDTLRWVVIYIASVWWQTGTNFIIFSGALRNVPKSLYEACEMDGGGRWKKIVYVTLPNIKASVAICLFNTLIAYLGLFGQPYALNDATNQDIIVSPMMFIQTYLTGGIVYARQTGYICASAVVFGLIVMVFSIIQRKCMSERTRRTCYANKCRAYSESKNMLSEEAATVWAQEGRYE